MKFFIIVGFLALLRDLFLLARVVIGIQVLFFPFQDVKTKADKLI